MTAEAPMSAESDKLERKIMGVRVGLVLSAVICYFGTLFVITHWGTYIPTAEAAAALGSAEPVVVLDQEKVWTALEWLIGAVFGLAIAGDTARPSGSKHAAFGISTNNGNGAAAEG
jgi:hypothetical protein